MRAGREPPERLGSAGGDESAAPALHLLDAVALTKAEAHLEDAERVQTDATQKPADGRRQPRLTRVPVVHLAASPRAGPGHPCPQAPIESNTVSQPPPGTQNAVRGPR